MEGGARATVRSLVQQVLQPTGPFTLCFCPARCIVYSLTRARLRLAVHPVLLVISVAEPTADLVSPGSVQADAGAALGATAAGHGAVAGRPTVPFCARLLEIFTLVQNVPLFPRVAKLRSLGL